MNDMIYYYGQGAEPTDTVKEIRRSRCYPGDYCRHSLFNYLRDVPSPYVYMIFSTLLTMPKASKARYIDLATRAINDIVALTGSTFEYSLREDGTYWFSREAVRRDATLYWLPTAAVREAARIARRKIEHEFTTFEDLLSVLPSQLSYPAYRWYTGYARRLRAGARTHEPIGYRHFTSVFTFDF